MLEQLKKAGCHNYSIYLKGLDLFAYMEVDDFQHYLAVMADSEVAQRWEAYMSDILIRETNPSTGFPDVLSEVFHLDKTAQLGISAQIFSGLSGISILSMPSGASASRTAFAIAGGPPRQPASPTPFTPSGLVGEGVSTNAVVKVGTMLAVGRE